ncbi:MAG: glycosyltransferase, partial [Pseudomonadota bacterium]
VFVFPSKTDTLGLVILEAMACGVPVAAYPVPGPQDLIIDDGNGAIDKDLGEAVFRALAVCADNCIDYASQFSWQACTDHFVQRLVPAYADAEQALDPTRAARTDAYNRASCPSTLPAPKPASTSPLN